MKRVLRRRRKPAEPPALLRTPRPSLTYRLISYLLVFPVFLLAWLRFGIGALAMLGWLRRPADEAALTPATHKLLFLSALLGNFRQIAGAVAWDQHGGARFF